MKIFGIKISLPIALDYKKKEYVVTKKTETDECKVCVAKIVPTSCWLGLREGKSVVHLKKNEKIQIKKI